MSVFYCHCGFRIPLTADDHEWKLISSERFYASIERSAQAAVRIASTNSRDPIEELLGPNYPVEVGPAGAIHDITSDILLADSFSVVRCPSCRRLHVQEAPGSARYLTYELSSQADPDCKGEQSIGQANGHETGAEIDGSPASG